MKPYEVEGRVSSVGQVQKITERFSKRVVAVEIGGGQFGPDLLALELTRSGARDHTNEADGLREGDMVRAKFYVSSRESPNRPGSWYTSCRCVGIEKVADAAADDVSEPDDTGSDQADDQPAADSALPF